MSDMTHRYPDELAIEPLRQQPNSVVHVPGSKSITNRGFVLAALADPRQGTELRGILRSEDTEVMVDGLRALGFRVDVDWENSRAWVCRGNSSRIIPAEEADLFVANSGTSMRFLTALASLGQGRYRLDGVTRMRERPIEDLLSALQRLGVNAQSELGNGLPPVILETQGWNGREVAIRGDVSSQFLSGLLMAAPLSRDGLAVRVEGTLVSKPYVAMTVAMMRQFGVEVETDLATYFHVPAVPFYSTLSYDVEPDASAASYFWGAAAICGGTVSVTGLDNNSLQGDVRFAQVLKTMGCDLTVSKVGISVSGRMLRGSMVEMNDISDCVMTLAAVACFAQGPTKIYNVAHIRHKETDRLAALTNELRRVGAEVEEFADGLTITPGPLHGATIETYNDHRMAMSMALIGLRVPGIVIRNPGCVAKTYPDFFDDLKRLG